MRVALWLPCIIMFIIDIFAVFLGDAFTVGSYAGSVDIINGTTVSTQGYSLVFDISGIQGGFLILTGIVSVASLVGIQIFGSGLSDESVETITGIIVFIALWTFLSILAYNLIISIQVFGVILWFILSFVYVIGCIQKLTGD